VEKIEPIKSPTDEAVELAERFRRPLMSFFRRRVREPQDAEDLTHEVFLRLLRRDEAVPVDNPEIYVFRVAANLLRDRARRAASHRTAGHISLDDLIRETTEARTIEAALLEDRGPERVLLSREALMEEMKHRDIAAAYGMAVSTVEKHVARGSVHLVRRFGAK
jgi:RNA polymerase sigma-70 factor (ECF subfamily)